MDAVTTNPLQQVKKPPKYMVDLYNTIADRHGITRAPGLLDADTVRSIPNIGQYVCFNYDQHHFPFCCEKFVMLY